MKASTWIIGSFILVLSGMAVIAQTFPPVAVTGPFPKGTEEIRHDAPVDSTRTSSPMIYHEYTCYKVKNAPVIDGNIETDSIWSKIPWTVMTFLEEQASDRTFTVFSGDTSATWSGPKDCTGWFKLLWDDDKVYGAVKIYTNIFNPVLDTSDLNNIYQSHCIQFSINSAPPASHLDFPEDPYMGCELGLGLATVYPVDSQGVAITTAVPDTSEVYHYWNPEKEPNAMSLAPGNNTRSNGSVKGKAVHISVEKTPDYYVIRYEFALSINDSVNFWSPYIHDDHVDRFSIMAMDYDDVVLEDVTWASGILMKDYSKFGSIKWSVNTPDGISIPTGVKKAGRLDSESRIAARFSGRSGEIGYTVFNYARINLNVYDISGRKIAALVNKEQAPGAYHVRFDAARLPKGVYMCKLRTNASESTRMVMFTK